MCLLSHIRLGTKEGLAVMFWAPWSKPEELRSVLTATAKARGTDVYSIMTAVAYFGRHRSQKQQPVNWEEAQSRE